MEPMAIKYDHKVSQIIAYACTSCVETCSQIIDANASSFQNAMILADVILMERISVEKGVIFADFPPKMVEKICEIKDISLEEIVGEKCDNCDTCRDFTCLLRGKLEV